MSASSIPEPWRSFLHALDSLLQEEVFIYCLGGFVVTQLYGFKRSTSDLDFIWMAPNSDRELLLAQAGENRPLHKKYGVYLQYTAMADVPENYEDRLVPMYEGEFKYLRFLALEEYDLCLAKLTRNSERDREDVKYLAKAKQLDPAVLKHRYESEMHAVAIAANERIRSYLSLWLEMIEESQQSTSRRRSR
jgi:Nucleotidyltransferase of unknown function (DUF6036)